MTRVGCRHEAPASCVKGRSPANGRASHAAPLSATTTSAACAPAVKPGSDLFHLHGDHLGSAALTTDGAGAATASRTYYAYGAERSTTGDLQTDHTFTGQKRAASRLLYDNARDDDPALGAFISPDSMVPDAGIVIDGNRLLHTRGNPLGYSDPSGKILACVKGGSYPINEGKPGAFIQSCQKAAEQAGWSEE